MGEYDDLLGYGAGKKPATAAPAGEYDDLMAHGKPAAPESHADAPPGLFERIGTGFARMGRIVSAGAGAAAEGVMHPLDTITDPHRRREFERGLDNMVTLGYGQKLADAAGRALGDRPDVQIAATSEADRAAAPGFREAGSIAGLFTPGATSAIAKGGGQLVKTATGGIKAGSMPAAAALGAVRGVGGYEATAPLTAALSADASGNRLGAAREAATDPASLILSGVAGGGAGAVSRASESAPARVLERTRKDITTGEQNAGIRLTRKVAERAGEDNTRLASLLERDPALEKVLAVKASTSPAKALKATDTTLERVDGRLDEIYGTMAKADRLVTPQDIANGFDKIAGERLKAGDLPAVNILRAERARFLNEYGKFGKLSPETMRGLKATAGKGAFEGQPIPGSVRRDIWAAYADAIETQAKGTKGVNVKELRELNSDRSVLLPIRDALAERATSAAAGRHSIGHLIHAPATAIGAAAGGALLGTEMGHHGIEGAVVGLLAPTAAKLARQGGRAADYALAKRFKGAAPDLSSGAGARAASLDYAGRVAEAMRNGSSLKDAVDAADEAD